MEVETHCYCTMKIHYVKARLLHLNNSYIPSERRAGRALKSFVPILMTLVNNNFISDLMVCPFLSSTWKF